ncbi:hypothetical protein GGQ80_002953 [Sphingomonas jinjuensis]|uniref:Glycosyltransferase 61 catalytic domain-containing protein n=1 Tax=Sphingomonas jinjuensis TaxID=535907 RepID=A0A840FFQ8_9SPHN|nr:glycosyltransferase family 61 protein [Sphingomonas jinjuensis]MBB4155036.1 hypothetical protein [Sphingomonas jinjuensis]
MVETVTLSPWRRALPIIARVRGKAGLGRTYRDHAEAIELAPAERIYSPGILSLPGESERATGTMPHTTVDEIRQLENEGEFSHGATLAYRIDNALLADGCVYYGYDYNVVTPGISRAPFIPGHVDRHGEAQLSSDTSSEMYFGHWLLDGQSTELLAADRGLDALAFGPPATHHKAEYRSVSGLDVRPVRYAAVDRLWVIDDRGLNSARNERWARLRDRVRALAAPPSSPERVYLVRSGGTSGRSVNNADAFEAALARHDFASVDPMKHSVAEIAGLLSRAKLVVSIEGSHQSHALMAMPPGSTLLTIQPADRFLHSYLFFANVAGIRSAYTIAEQECAGYRVDLDRLERTLDLIG